ncbi:hypothetical protein DRO97_10145 [Archaeoglobales archaeon]|nr:MAG: hypothetical protein DRO97_10145 [Archaeoglobales archaeon]
MTTVLWLSRHHPLPVQIDYLTTKLGDFDLIIYDKPISTANDALDLALEYNASYIIPVLPLSFIAHLVTVTKSIEPKITILRAEMETIHNCSQIPCPEYNEYTDTIMQSKDFNTGQIIYRHFRFKEFVILKDIKIVTERWE